MPQLLLIVGPSNLRFATMAIIIRLSPEYTKTSVLLILGSQILYIKYIKFCNFALSGKGKYFLRCAN